MKRKFHFEMDESSDFALSVVATMEALQPSPESNIGVPALKLYNLASKYLEMYRNINKGRSTFVDNSRQIH
jgi:hypothetical protein